MVNPPVCFVSQLNCTTGFPIRHFFFILYCNTSIVNLQARLINLIGRIDDTKFRMGIVERDLKMIEAGMKQMDEYERALLEGFFVHGAKNAAESMMNRFYKERSTIYNDRRKALEKFTRSVYGLVMV